MAPAGATVRSQSAAVYGADAEIEEAGAAADLGKDCSPLGLSIPPAGPDVDEEEDGFHSRVLTAAVDPTVTNRSFCMNLSK